jgi:2,3-bisphosphoglycerate-independent phosphoglycerate mutase
MKRKVGLIILDGWGLGDQTHSDAIYNAHTPFFDGLMTQYPNATLQTSGEAVGLPDGQMGNSEVGHLNIGAGRIVYQELTRINKSIRDGELQQNPVLLKAFQKAKELGKKLHFVGLVSMEVCIVHKRTCMHSVRWHMLQVLDRIMSMPSQMAEIATQKVV